MVVLDTQADWEWWIKTWQFVYDAAEVGPEDRVFMAFSFGPFIGFWSANDAAIARGALTIPGGGISTLGRLELIRSSKATTLLCTPSYAMHMADVAAENQIHIGYGRVAQHEETVRVQAVAVQVEGVVDRIAAAVIEHNDQAAQAGVGVTEEFGGHTFLRFDDTNPLKESEEYGLLSSKAKELQKKQNLFAGKLFYLNREVPKLSLQWLILSFGG